MDQIDQIKVVQEKLIEGLKGLYPLALKADETLEALKEEQKGRFSAVFQADSGFRASSDRFLPYLVELSDEVQSLPMMEPVNQQSKIQEVLKKIQLMHQVLGQFHSISETE